MAIKFLPIPKHAVFSCFKHLNATYTVSHRIGPQKYAKIRLVHYYR